MDITIPERKEAKEEGKREEGSGGGGGRETDNQKERKSCRCCRAQSYTSYPPLFGSSGSPGQRNRRASVGPPLVVPLPRRPSAPSPFPAPLVAPPSWRRRPPAAAGATRAGSAPRRTPRPPPRPPRPSPPPQRGSRRSWQRSRWTRRQTAGERGRASPPSWACCPALSGSGQTFSIPLCDNYAGSLVKMDR